LFTGTLGVVLTINGPSASSVTGVEVVHDVVGNAFVQKRIDHMHRGRHQQGVAIGRGLGDGVGADYSRRAAGAILDDEVLAHRLVELLHQDARNAIDRSAGRKRHHDGNRA
jgi:hypothetical protein